MADPRFPPIYPGLSKARLLWLVRLRWFALAGVTLGTVAAALGLNPGINLPVLATSIVAGALFNLYFWKQIQTQSVTPRAGMMHVLVDIGALTLVLWAGGGPDVPFQSFYFFHIIIGGILVGPGAAVVTALAALGAVGFLEVSRLVPALNIASWTLPDPAWERGLYFAGLVLTVASIAYFVIHIMNELHSQLRAVAEERERASNALARLTFTLDRMDAGMEVLDHEGHRIWFNQTFQRLFPGQELGVPWGCPGAHDGCDSGRCPVTTAFGATEPHRCMLSVERAGGVHESYELLSYPLSSDRSAPQVMNLYLNRTLEQALQRRVDQAERLAAFGRLAQGLAHELNTPLGTVHALTADIEEVLAHTPLDPAQEALAAVHADVADSCRIILDEARRCKRITTTLLSGRDLYGEDHPRPVGVRRLLDQSCVLAFSGADARPKVTVTASGGINLYTDPDRLLQVLLNVLRNARDAAGDEGEIEVEARAQGGGVTVTVVDDGPGIPPEVGERLFEPFFTTKEPGQGTGLGLYTSYQIIHRLGGHIEVDNAPKGGARVRIWLPARTPDGDAPSPSLSAGAP